jgi:AraC-like DNA-binding protein
MRFETITPSAPLRPYIKQYVISEQAEAHLYKVLPSTGMVIGFQYQGKLSTVGSAGETTLATSGITGLADTYKIFKNTPATGSMLVYFTETGFVQFAKSAAHELFNQSISLEHVFDKNAVREIEDRLAESKTDRQRIDAVEEFLLRHLHTQQTDALIVAAVKLIYENNGTLPIKALIEKLCISQSPFEKRFRKLVGTTPKKFASIVRFNHVLNTLPSTKSLTEIYYENNFFDQAHFTKDFKQFTGDTPENFKRLL